jgi:hypothetical protein
MPNVTQSTQASAKFIAHGVVGIIVKALVLPERVHFHRYCARSSASAAKCRDVFVSDLESGQSSWKFISIVLRIGARHWDGSNVNNERDVGMFEQIREFDDCPR